MVTAVPVQLQFGATRESSNYVKAADSGVVNYNESAIPQELISSLLFEDIGGVELINVSRHDIINGAPVNYSLVGNLTSIQTMFNSTNIISGFETKDTYMNQYPIDIGQRIESIAFDDDGNLIIDFSDMAADENVEVIILADGIVYVI